MARHPFRSDGRSTFDLWKENNSWVAEVSAALSQNLTGTEKVMNITIPSSTEFSGFDVSILKPRRRVGRPKALTAEQELLVAKLVELGFSLNSIGQMFGIHGKTVGEIHARNTAQQ